MKLSKMLKKIRLERGLTQAQFGAMFNVRRYNIVKYESGASAPNALTLMKILRFGNRLK